MSRFDLGNGVADLTALLAEIDDPDLDKPTPCPRYTLRDLVAHVDMAAQAFTASARKQGGKLVEVTPDDGAPELAADWRTRLPRHLETLADAWRVPDAWVGTTRIAGQDAPAEMVAMTIADEIVVHSWDIATALGRWFSADPELLIAAKAFLSAFSTPDAPAGDDVPFGPSRPAPEDASELEQVVALAGRDPSWQSPD